MLVMPRRTTRTNSLLEGGNNEVADYNEEKAANSSPTTTSSTSPLRQWRNDCVASHSSSSLSSAAASSSPLPISPRDFVSVTTLYPTPTNERNKQFCSSPGRDSVPQDFITTTSSPFPSTTSTTTGSSSRGRRNSDSSRATASTSRGKTTMSDSNQRMNTHAHSGGALANNDNYHSPLPSRPPLPLPLLLHPFLVTIHYLRHFLNNVTTSSPSCEGVIDETSSISSHACDSPCTVQRSQEQNVPAEGGTESVNMVSNTSEERKRESGVLRMEGREGERDEGDRLTSGYVSSSLLQSDRIPPVSTVFIETSQSSSPLFSDDGEGHHLHDHTRQIHTIPVQTSPLAVSPSRTVLPCAVRLEDVSLIENACQLLTHPTKQLPPARRRRPCVTFDTSVSSVSTDKVESIGLHHCSLVGNSSSNRGNESTSGDSGGCVGRTPSHVQAASPMTNPTIGTHNGSHTGSRPISPMSLNCSCSCCCCCFSCCTNGKRNRPEEISMEKRFNASGSTCPGTYSSFARTTSPSSIKDNSSSNQGGDGCCNHGSMRWMDSNNLSAKGFLSINKENNKTHLPIPTITTPMSNNTVVSPAQKTGLSSRPEIALELPTRHRQDRSRSSSHSRTHLRLYHRHLRTHHYFTPSHDTSRTPPTPLQSAPAPPLPASQGSPWKSFFSSSFSKAAKDSSEYPAEMSNQSDRASRSLPSLPFSVVVRSGASLSCCSSARGKSCSSEVPCESHAMKNQAKENREKEGTSVDPSFAFGSCDTPTTQRCRPFSTFFSSSHRSLTPPALPLSSHHGSSMFATEVDSHYYSLPHYISVSSAFTSSFLHDGASSYYYYYPFCSPRSPSIFQEEDRLYLHHQQQLRLRFPSFNAIEILPGLYLSAHHCAADLQALKAFHISLVVNVAMECPIHEHLRSPSCGVRFHQYLLRDHSDERISPLLVPVAQFIHRQLHRRKAYYQRLRRAQEAQGILQASMSTPPTPYQTSPSTSPPVTTCMEESHPLLPASLQTDFRDSHDDCGGVLVHCRMGISRSATIILAYLMIYGDHLEDFMADEHNTPSHKEEEEENNMKDMNRSLPAAYTYDLTTPESWEHEMAEVHRLGGHTYGHRSMLSASTCTSTAAPAVQSDTPSMGEGIDVPGSFAGSVRENRCTSGEMELSATLSHSVLLPITTPLVARAGVKEIATGGINKGEKLKTTTPITTITSGASSSTVPATEEKTNCNDIDRDSSSSSSGTNNWVSFQSAVSFCPICDRAVAQRLKKNQENSSLASFSKTARLEGTIEFCDTKAGGRIKKRLRNRKKVHRRSCSTSSSSSGDIHVSTHAPATAEKRGTAKKKSEAERKKLIKSEFDDPAAEEVSTSMSSATISLGMPFTRGAACTSRPFPFASSNTSVSLEGECPASDLTYVKEVHEDLSLMQTRELAAPEWASEKKRSLKHKEEKGRKRECIGVNECEAYNIHDNNSATGAFGPTQPSDCSLSSFVFSCSSSSSYQTSSSESNPSGSASGKSSNQEIDENEEDEGVCEKKKRNRKRTIGWSMKDALQYVHSLKADIDPNFGFVIALKDLEEKLSQ